MECYIVCKSILMPPLMGMHTSFEGAGTRACSGNHDAGEAAASAQNST